MKQLNKMFMAASLMAATFLGTYAADVTFTVKVNDPESLTITVAGQQLDVQESNVITAKEYGYDVSVVPVEGYSISSVVNKAGTPQSVWGGSWYPGVTADMEGEEFTVTTYNIEASRTATFTLGVDDPSLVTLFLGTQNSQNYTPAGIEAGDNTVKFNPETENWLSVMPKEYGGLIYKVTKDGETIMPNTWGNYMTEISEGCNVDITAIVPDIDITVNFEYSEGSEGCINHVAVNGSGVSDFNGKSLSIKAGSGLAIYGNIDFDIKDCVINGVPFSWYGDYIDIPGSFLMEDATISLTAVPITPVNFTLTVDNPQYVQFFNSSYPSGTPMEVVAGSQDMKVPDNNAVISWKAAANCYVEKVVVNGEELDVTKTSYVNIKEGDVIEVASGHYVLDNTAVLWLAPSDNLLWNLSYYMDSKYDRYELVEGYQLIEFYDAMNPFSFSFYDDGDDSLWRKLYCNDEIVEPNDWGGYSDLKIGNGDVYKYFTNSAPQECSVTFEITGNADSFAVCKDLIVPVKDFSAPVGCFAGTLMEIIPSENAQISVSIDNVELSSDENGRYSFTVADASTTVKVTATEVGVDSVAESENADANVYNMLGVKVGVRSGIDRLPSGIYVVNGRKIVVR